MIGLGRFSFSASEDACGFSIGVERISIFLGERGEELPLISAAGSKRGAPSTTSSSGIVSRDTGRTELGVLRAGDMTPGEVMLVVLTPLPAGVTGAATGFAAAAGAMVDRGRAAGLLDALGRAVTLDRRFDAAPAVVEAVPVPPSVVRLLLSAAVSSLGGRVLDVVDRASLGVDLASSLSLVVRRSVVEVGRVAAEGNFGAAAVDVVRGVDGFVLLAVDAVGLVALLNLEEAVVGFFVSSSPAFALAMAPIVLVLLSMMGDSHASTRNLQSQLLFQPSS